MITPDTWLLVRKVAALRLLNGQDVEAEDVVREWALGELEGNGFAIAEKPAVHPLPWDGPVKTVVTPPAEDPVAVFDRIGADIERDRLADVITPTDERVLAAIRQEPKLDEATPEPATPTEPVKKGRRTKAEMEVVRQTIRKAYGDKVMSAPVADGWEAAHTAALAYVDSLGPEPAINLAPAQVRAAVASEVDIYRRRWEAGRTRTAVTSTPELSPQAAQTARNVELINQGINPRTGQPFSTQEAQVAVPAADPELTDELFDQFLSGSAT